MANKYNKKRKRVLPFFFILRTLQTSVCVGKVSRRECSAYLLQTG